MTAQTLRLYQENGARRVLDAWRGGARKVLMVSPTGSGKTSTFTSIAAGVVGAGRRAVLLVHRRELATQAAARLREFGVDHGFIMAGEPTRPYARMQVASVQTLIRRTPPCADLVICDEAHLSTATTWATILAAYPQARILGATATPWRLGGKPLVGAYDECVVVATPAELREQGYLCPYNGFSYQAPDLSEVETTGGDYNEKQSAKAMRAPGIVANIVEQWQAHASTLSTVLFAVTVEHSKALCSEFKTVGVRAEHLDGSTGLDARKGILKRVESGETQVLCNVGVAVEGLDIPRLKCCILARPTKSLARAIQMMGRVRRPWQGVTARIHDHAFVIGAHGLPDAERDYNLHAKPEKPPSLSQCPECLAYYGGPSCTACGREKEREPAGERVLQTVEDAEQFDFSSGDDPFAESPAAVEAAQSDRPVSVRWDKIGKVVEGIFSKAWGEPVESRTQKRMQRMYRVIGKTRDYTFPGTVALNSLMQSVKEGDQIRLTYTGEGPVKTGQMYGRKEFRLERDDGIPAAPATCSGPGQEEGQRSTSQTPDQRAEWARKMNAIRLAKAGD